MNTRHYGKDTETGKLLVILFRHIYDSNGNIIEEENGLVIYPEEITNEFVKSEFMNIVNSASAQQERELYTILSTSRLMNGDVFALSWLRDQGYIKKVNTSKVLVTETNDVRSQFTLNIINKIIKYQSQGKNEQEIRSLVPEIMQQQNPQQASQPMIGNQSVEGILPPIQAPHLTESAMDSIGDLNNLPTVSQAPSIVTDMDTRVPQQASQQVPQSLPQNNTNELLNTLLEEVKTIKKQVNDLTEKKSAKKSAKKDKKIIQ